MQIFVELAGSSSSTPDASSELPEWVIVELQGTLETSGHKTNLSGRPIGNLCFTKQGAPILIIGHHALHGKLVTMDKPFGVLVKSTSGDGEKSGTMVLKALVKKKLVFKSRPKPIVTNVPKKT